MAKKIAVFVGSLRKEAYSRKMAKALIALAPASLSLEIIEIGDMPFFNQDLEDSGNSPKSWTLFREQVKKCDAFLFVTPEYNRGMPAALKNAIDVGSRPHGQSVWEGKRAGVVSVSPGNLGGFGANHNFRQTMVFLNVPVMQQPEAYIGGAKNLFDANGALVNESTSEFLKKFMAAFAVWVGDRA
jgi:chromate reductase, NAD(P)H dehydrogenase (quinone)